jgi:hypothetical protein
VAILVAFISILVGASLQEIEANSTRKYNDELATTEASRSRPSERGQWPILKSMHDTRVSFSLHSAGSGNLLEVDRETARSHRRFPSSKQYLTGVRPTGLAIAIEP